MCAHQAEVSVVCVCVYKGVSLLSNRARALQLYLRFAPHYSAVDALASHTLCTLAATYFLYDPTHRDLSNNKLTSIPVEIWQLTSLTYL